LKAGIAGLATAGAAAGGVRAQQAPPSPDLDALPEAAVRLFIAEGRTCAEAMLSAGCEALGVEGDVVPEVAYGLAGGVGLQGRTCGLLLGAAMALGVGLGPGGEYPQNLMRVCEEVRGLCADFEERFGTSTCRELCGLDLTTPEGRKELKESVKPDKCRLYAEETARMLAERLRRAEAAG
jgi:C_GCAxxG_C_C family probable redox protein